MVGVIVEGWCGCWWLVWLLMVVDGCHWLVCLLMVGVFVDGWCGC